MRKIPDLELSVIIPVYNESATLHSAARQLIEYCENLKKSFEIIFVNDGSTDRSAQILEELTAADQRIRPIIYFPNRGAGFALRQGFKQAAGKIIITLDADLSYSVDHISAFLDEFRRHPYLDMVVGSAYMKGGSSTNVPILRNLMSRWGNRIISLAFQGKIKTATCVLRAYRNDMIQNLNLSSSGKEIHLEILGKAMANDYVIEEIPAHLKWEKKTKRRSGGFHLKNIISSHVIFSFSERPMMLFGLAGMIFIGFGLFFGGIVLYHWLTETLNPTRPLIPLLVLLIITGIQAFLFGFLGLELSSIKKEIFRLRKRADTNTSSDITP